MEGYIYILRFKNGKYYTGSTNNLERRLIQHTKGHTSSTKNLGEFELVFAQKMPNIQIARSIERKIKSWKRRDFIEKIINDGFIKTI